MPVMFRKDDGQRGSLFGCVCIDCEQKAARIRELEGYRERCQAMCGNDKARIRELEALLTKFLVWNGTDYEDDEKREYDLVGICEEAYQLLPYSQSDAEVNSET